MWQPINIYVIKKYVIKVIGKDCSECKICDNGYCDGSGTQWIW